MPSVAIYESPDVNAFATGPSQRDSLVAVSSGLLMQMNQQEAEGVLGHEISHIANGDMVTMTLLQGVLNTFVIVFARLAGLLIDRALRGNRDSQSYSGPGPGYFIASLAAQFVFGILASMIVMWFSRRREFHADAGSARIAGRQKMIAALQRLQTIHEPAQLPQQLTAFGIHNGLAGLFRSHPPLPQRIAALQQLSN
jgi:heat shock protein HtpX